MATKCKGCTFDGGMFCKKNARYGSKKCIKKRW